MILMSLIQFKKELMKYSLGLILFSFFFLIISCSIISTERSQSNKSSKIFKANSELDNKGKYVTSVGELRTLIVYATFTDDISTKSKAWNFSKTQLPAWTKKMINSTTKLSFPNENLTQYFYEMSRGNFMLYGDIYPKVIIPKYNQKHYKSISDVNYEILTRLDDEIDYSKYDNWSKGKDGKYLDVPDGKVDVIFIVYRNFENRLFFNNGWTGSAHFYLTDDIVTNDGVKITSGRLDKGSGVQSRGGKVGFTYMKYVLAHEFGHLLFGAGHIENTTNLALMTGGPVWNASRGMHSWERSRLGWTDFEDIQLDKNTSIEIDDYMTTGNAYRIKLNDKEWFILENHQKLSKNDWAKDKGVYIFHVNNAHRFSPSVTVECADGKWDFEVDEEKQKLIKTIPNSSGKTEMNFRKTIKKKSYSCYKQVYADNSAWGDANDAYDISYNNIFSPVSNPSSQNKAKINFAIEIKERRDKKYLLDVLFNDIYINSVPSKPQIINIEQKEPTKVLLRWFPNKEPDLLRYNIYYSLNQNDKLKNFKRLKININKNKEEINLSSLLQDKGKKISVAITSFDKSGKESVMSDIIELTYNSKNKKWDWKRVEEY
jgi:M6 family metalloprotease-like protein